MKKTNLLLIALVVLLVVVPLLYAKDAEFSGADNQARDMITQIQPNYQPWFESVWTPPSGEIESLLFALQAALGAGFVGYFIGYSKGKKKPEERASHVKH